MTDKLKKTVSFIVNVLVVGFFAYLVITLIWFPPNLAENYCHRRYDTVYKGVIIRIGGGNSGDTFRLRDGKIFLPKCQELIQGKVEVGDSLYKPKNSFDMYIYKKANPDSVIYIPCDFDCNIVKENYSEWAIKTPWQYRTDKCIEEINKVHMGKIANIETTHEGPFFYLTMIVFFTQNAEFLPKKHQ